VLRNHDDLTAEHMREVSAADQQQQQSLLAPTSSPSFSLANVKTTFVSQLRSLLALQPLSGFVDEFRTPVSFECAARALIAIAKRSGGGSGETVGGDGGGGGAEAPPTANGDATSSSSSSSSSVVSARRSADAPAEMDEADLQRRVLHVAGPSRLSRFDMLQNTRRALCSFMRIELGCGARAQLRQQQQQRSLVRLLLGPADASDGNDEDSRLLRLRKELLDESTQQIGEVSRNSFPAPEPRALNLSMVSSFPPGSEISGYLGSSMEECVEAMLRELAALGESSA
jgi:hypothetical protein